MTDAPDPTPTGPIAQPLAMRILAGTVPFQPGMDPDNPLHILHIEFGPLISEIQIPESNVEPFIEALTGTLRRQVAAARRERMGAAPQGLLLPGMGAMPLPGMNGHRA